MRIHAEKPACSLSGPYSYYLGYIRFGQALSPILKVNAVCRLLSKSICWVKTGGGRARGGGQVFRRAIAAVAEPWGTGMTSRSPRASTAMMPMTPARWKPKIVIDTANIAGPKKLTARPVVA